MVYLQVITVLLLLAVLLQRRISLTTLKGIERRQMGQEQQLQDVQTLLGTVASGVTEIISRLNALPGDNPAIQDEIDGIKGVAQGMANEIDAVLNPPSPAPAPEPVP